MAVELNIIIKGIAMSYTRQHAGEKFLGVIFPFDKCHTLKLKESENAEGVSLAGPNRRIKVYALDPTASSAYDVDADYVEFLNLTHNDPGVNNDPDRPENPNRPAEFLHKDGVKTRPGWKQNGVLMKLMKAKFSVGTVCKRRMGVYQFPENTSKTEVREPTSASTPTLTKQADFIALNAKATIAAKENSCVVFEVSDDTGVVFYRTFKKDATIILDNDCHDPASQDNDFLMVYGVIRDKYHAGRQFFTKREVLPDMAVRDGQVLQIQGVSSLNAATNGLALSTAVSLGQYMGTFLRTMFESLIWHTDSGTFEDSEGRLGLPCHKVRIGNIGEDSKDMPDLDF